MLLLQQDDIQPQEDATNVEAAEEAEEATPLAEDESNKDMDRLKVRGEQAKPEGEQDQVHFTFTPVTAKALQRMGSKP